jgi:hypothetical protein
MSRPTPHPRPDNPGPDPFAQGRAYLDIYGLGDHPSYRRLLADVAAYGWPERYVVSVARALVRLEARRHPPEEVG